MQSRFPYRRFCLGSIVRFSILILVCSVAAGGEPAKAPSDAGGYEEMGRLTKAQAVVKGRDLARRDFAAGKHWRLVSGLPEFGYVFYRDCLRHEFGVEPILLGCVRTRGLVAGEEAYNREMVSLEKEKFGKDLYQEAVEKAPPYAMAYHIARVELREANAAEMIDFMKRKAKEIIERGNSPSGHSFDIEDRFDTAKERPSITYRGDDIPYYLAFREMLRQAGLDFIKVSETRIAIVDAPRAEEVKK
jgi:hypothetical protein